MKEIKLNVSGMHCRSCEMLIKDALEEIKGVKDVEANHSQGTVRLLHEDNVRLDEIKKTIEREGYKVIEK